MNALPTRTENISRDRLLLVLFLVLLTAFCYQSVAAQTSFLLSRNADFSTDDSAFDRTDILYARIVAPEIDFSDLRKNSFRLKPRRGGNDIRGSFINHFDSSYTVTIDLSTTDPAETTWRWRSRIKDRKNHELRLDLTVSIGLPSGGMAAAEDFDIKGPITGVGADNVSISGVLIRTDGTTAIEDDRGNAVTLAAIVVGGYARVRGERVAGVLLARNIELDDKDDTDGEMELTGLVEDIQTDQITVLGLSFIVTDSTLIVDNSGLPIQLSSIAIGTIIELRGVSDSTGARTATRLEVEDTDKNEVKIVGIVESVSESSITISSLQFEITSETNVRSESGESISVSSISAGSFAEVEGVIALDGSLRATEIRQEDRRQDEIELTGTISRLSGTTVVVSDVSFTVDSTTVVLDRRGETISFSSLSVGQLVEIEGRTNSIGSLIARKIKIEEQVEDEIELTGTIDFVSADSIVVESQVFRIVAGTKVFNMTGTEVSVDELMPGQIVEIRGRLLPGGTKVAERIKLENGGIVEFEFTGPIEAVDASTITVVGVAFQIDISTQILDDAGNAATSTILAVGQTVEIKSLKSASGVFTATRIKIEDVTIVTGSIASVSQGQISVSGLSFSVDTNTLILDNSNQLIDFSRVSSAMFARVRGVESTTGRIATKITLSGSLAATSAESLPVNVPTFFGLTGNYPNPFQSTTKITFTVSQGSGKMVTLDVFDVLGRRIRRLLETDHLTAGSYEYPWNGTDQSGTPVSSGIYVYRLTVGDRSDARTVTMIR